LLWRSLCTGSAHGNCVPYYWTRTVTGTSPEARTAVPTASPVAPHLRGMGGVCALPIVHRPRGRGWTRGVWGWLPSWGLCGPVTSTSPRRAPCPCGRWARAVHRRTARGQPQAAHDAAHVMCAHTRSVPLRSCAHEPPSGGKRLPACRHSPVLPYPLLRCPPPPDVFRYDIIELARGQSFVSDNGVNVRVDGYTEAPLHLYGTYGSVAPQAPACNVCVVHRVRAPSREVQG
jgi:hypothetical protein